MNKPPKSPHFQHVTVPAATNQAGGWQLPPLPNAALCLPLPQEAGPCPSMTRTETPQTPAPGAKRKLFSQRGLQFDRLYSCNELLAAQGWLLLLQNYFSVSFL